MAIADDTVGDAPPHRRATRSIRDLPAAERPRERLALRGPGGLSAAELIALVLGTGGGGHSAIELAETLVRRHDSLRALARASDVELAATPGLGQAKAARLAAAFELGRRSVADWPAGRWTIRSPADVARPARGGHGPPRARGAAGAQPQHEERRATGDDRVRGQRLGVAGPDRRAVPGRGAPRRGGDRARAQPPERRPDAVPGRPPPHGRGDRRRDGCSTWTCSTTS